MPQAFFWSFSLSFRPFLADIMLELKSADLSAPVGVLTSRLLFLLWLLLLLFGVLDRILPDEGPSSQPEL